MKRIALAGLGVVWVGVAAWAGSPSSRPAASVRHGQDGDFGVLLTYTKDKAFFDHWNKPEMPQVSPPANVKRGETLYVIPLFAGAKADAKGIGTLEMTFKILRPDGTVYAEQTVPAWEQAVPKGRNLGLAQASPAIGIEKTDPVGTYQLRVTLSDKNAGKRVSLELPFEVVEQ